MSETWRLLKPGGIAVFDNDIWSLSLQGLGELDENVKQDVQVWTGSQERPMIDIGSAVATAEWAKKEGVSLGRFMFWIVKSDQEHRDEGR